MFDERRLRRVIRVRPRQVREGPEQWIGISIIAVPLTGADYFADRDAALEAALGP